MGEAGKYLNELRPILNLTIEKDIYLKFLSFYLVEMVIVLILTLIMSIPAILYFLSKGIIQNPQLMSNPVILSEIIGLFVILGLVWIIIVAVIGALFEGARFSYAKSVFDKKRKTIGEAIAVGKERMVAVFGVSLIWGLISGIVTLVLMSPVIISFIDLIPKMQGGGSELAVSMVMLILYMVVMFFIIFIGLFILSPFMSMSSPIAVFEKKGAIDSFKRSFAIMKGNYVPTLLFLILVGAIVFAVGMVISIIGQVLSFMVLPFSFVGMEVYVGLILLVNLLLIILGVLVEAWDNALGTLAVTKLFTLNQKKNKK